MSKKASKPLPAPPAPMTEARSVLDVVVDIKAGSVNPKLLVPADRHACVAYLSSEGASVAEIAQLLKCSDRTVARDRKVLEEAGAIEHDPRLAGRIAGKLIADAELCRDRIRRVTRDRDTPPAVKVEGEKACFEVLCICVQRLQSLGYLPTAAQRVQAELTHHDGDLPSLEDLEQEVVRIQQAATDAGKGAPPELTLIRDEITRARLAGRVEVVSTSIVQETAHAL